jgi:hypothetical protein
MRFSLGALLLLWLALLVPVHSLPSLEPRLSVHDLSECSVSRPDGRDDRMLIYSDALLDGKPRDQSLRPHRRQMPMRKRCYYHLRVALRSGQLQPVRFDRFVLFCDALFEVKTKR